MHTPAEPRPAEYPLISVGGQYHFEDDATWKFFEDVNLSQQKTNYLYWTELTLPPTNRTQSDFKASFVLPQVDTSRPLQLSVQFVGVSQEGRYQKTQQHRILIRLNDGDGKLMKWPTGTRHVGHVTYPPGTFKADQNKLSFTIQAPATGEGATTGTDRIALDDILLDWFDLDFSQTTRLVNSYNEFYLPPGPKGEGPQRFSIQDFSGSNVLVFDLTNRQRLVATPFEQKPGRWMYNLNVQRDASLTTGPTHLVALTLRQCQKPHAIRPVELTDHFRRPEDCELLVLTHPYFKQELQRLADWKAGRGLKTAVVDITELFDEKGGGYASPRVLRDYIRHVHSSQPSPRLKYVLLVGDATSIAMYKTYLPAYSYLQSGLHANENYYANFSDPRGSPQIAVGRFSVRTVEQLRNAIDKTIAYERGDGSGVWRNTALLIAASMKWSENDAQRLAQTYLAPQFGVNLLKTDKSTTAKNYVEQINQQLTSNLNQGNLMTIFLGHGGGTVWQVGPSRVETNFALPIFNQSNVEKLTNDKRWPLVFALTCYTNNFDNPDAAQTLGEMFVNSRNGAIGVIGAAERTAVDSNYIFTSKMFDVLKERKFRRLGDVFVEAKRRINEPLVNAAYILLGDPSLAFEWPRNDIQVKNTRYDHHGGIDVDLVLPDGATTPATLDCRLYDQHFALVDQWPVTLKQRRETIRHTLPLTKSLPPSIIFQLSVYLNQGPGKDFNGGAEIHP